MAQVLATLAGEGEVLLGGEWRQAGPGTAYVTPPGKLHAYRAVRRGVWTVAWVIYAPPTRTCPGGSLAGPELLEGDASGLARTVDGLLREATGPRDAELLDHWAALVHGHAARFVETPEMDPRLAKLWQAVRDRLGETWSLSALARASGLSTEHLRRLCQAQLGTSPVKYLTRLRMHHAGILLAMPSYRIEDVGDVVGYENAFAFSSAFKRVMGQPPSAFRPK